jgi:RNA polymerase sigma factor (sigma-70 family)
MRQATLGPLLRYVRKLAKPEASQDLSDRELLECFRTQREEAAFTVLVQRHGPMVLAVGERVLGSRHDAEDIFQATFLVLAQKANSIRQDTSLAGWLHGVAQRLARKAGSRAAARRARERRSVEMPRAEPSDPMAWQELHSVLDQEIGGLPEKYRAPVVLCYLEGKSHAEAAGELGWPKTSLTSRLARAREILRQRLSSRGLALTAGLLAVTVTEGAAGAAVPTRLVLRTVRAASLLAAGKAATGAVSAETAALAEGAATTLRASKVRLVLLVAAGLAALGAGAGVLVTCPRRPHPHEWLNPPAVVAQVPEGRTKAKAPVDIHGDAIPAGALARMGSERLRHKATGGVAFSPDGKALFSGGQDGRVRMWDLASGKLQRVFKRRKAHLNERDSLTAVAVCPNGKVLAAAWGEGLQLWDVRTAKELRTLESGLVFALAFTPDGKHLASGSGRDGDIRIFDVASGLELRRLPWHPNGVTHLACQPGGKVIVSASLSAGVPGLLVNVGDLTTGKQLSSVFHPIDPPLALSPDGKTLAAGGVGKATVLLLDVMTGKEVCGFAGHPHGVNAVTFSPDGQTVASTGPDETIRWWDRATGKVIRKVTWRGPRAVPINWPGRLAFTPDGKTLVASCGDSTLRLWDMATGKQRQGPEGHEGGVDAVALSPDGKTLASCSGEDHTARLWDAATGRPLHVLRHPASVRRVLFSPDGKRILSGGGDGAVRVWDAATGKVVRTIRLSDADQGEGPEQVLDLALTADGKRVISLSLGQGGLKVAGQGYRLTTWDIATGKRFSQREADDDPLSALSADGRLLAGLAGAGVAVREAATGKETRSLPVPEGDDNFWYPLAFSPSHKLLATVSSKRVVNGAGRRVAYMVRVWEVATGKELWKCPTPCWGKAMAFSPDGKALAWAGDNVFAVHDAATGKELFRREGLDTCALSLAFSSDGARLATGLSNATVLIWDVREPGQGPRR